MDEDYLKQFQISEKVLDELGVDYVWRDACVGVLVETKRCMKNDYLSGIPFINKLSICKGIQDLWQTCEKDRELKLQEQFFTKYRTFSVLKEKDKQNKN